MTTKLRHLWREVDNRLGDKPPPPLLSVSQTLGVVRRELITDKPPRADSFDKYKICEAGDVVLNRFNAYRGSLGISNERGIVSPDYLVLRANRNSHPKFLDFLLRSEELSNFMKSTMGGLGASDPDVSGFSRIDVGSLGQYSVPTLDIQEQRAIANFLDRETAQIDDLIGKQERLVELLAEKRQAVITQAVTKGLDPTAPTKPSGLPWLDEVPASWAVSSIKHEWRVIDCKHITAEFVDAGVPLASIREVQGKFVNLDTAKRTTMTFYESMIEGNREPKVGDLIFSRNATVGEVAIVPSALEPFAMGQDVCLLKRRSTAASPDFGWYAMRSRYIQEQITLAMIGSTFKRINVEEIRSLTYCAPPLDEQRAIAKYLDERMSGIDKVVSSAATAVGLLLERRSALISAAVTGKINVTSEGVAA